MGVFPDQANAKSSERGSVRGLGAISTIPVVWVLYAILVPGDHWLRYIQEATSPPWSPPKALLRKD